MRRLADFRAVNTEDETVLNYFDELEIHPDHIGECNQMVFCERIFQTTYDRVSERSKALS